MSRIANLLNRPTSAELRRHHGASLAPCCVCDWPLFAVTSGGRVLCTECYPDARAVYRLVVIDSPAGSIGWDITQPRPQEKPPEPEVVTMFGQPFVKVEPGRYVRQGEEPCYPLGVNHDAWWAWPGKFSTPLSRKPTQ